MRWSGWSRSGNTEPSRPVTSQDTACFSLPSWSRAGCLGGGGSGSQGHSGAQAPPSACPPSPRAGSPPLDHLPLAGRAQRGSPEDIRGVRGRAGWGGGLSISCAVSSWCRAQLRVPAELHGRLADAMSLSTRGPGEWGRTHRSSHSQPSDTELRVSWGFLESRSVASPRC